MNYQKPYLSKTQDYFIIVLKLSINHYKTLPSLPLPFYLKELHGNTKDDSVSQYIIWRDSIKLALVGTLTKCSYIPIKQLSRLLLTHVEEISLERNILSGLTIVF